MKIWIAFVSLVFTVGLAGVISAQNVPLPPRTGAFSVQKLTTDGRRVSLAIAAPVRFEDGSKVPVGTQVTLEVLRSQDGGRTYRTIQKTESGGVVVHRDGGPQRLDATILLDPPAKIGETISLAARVRAGGQSSPLAREYLTFRVGHEVGQQIERFRTSGDAKTAAFFSDESRPPQWRLSPQQVALVKRFGTPDFFEMAYLRSEADLGRAKIDDRMEKWCYLSLRTEFSFVNGQLTQAKEFEGAPQVVTNPLYAPQDFTGGLTLLQLRQLVGKDQLKLLDLDKLEFQSRLFADVSVYLGPGLVVGFQGDQLTYVRSTPNWASQRSIQTRPSGRAAVKEMGYDLPRRMYKWHLRAFANQPVEPLTMHSILCGTVTYPGRSEGDRDPWVPEAPVCRRRGPLLLAAAGIIGIASVGYSVYGFLGDSTKVGRGVHAMGVLFMEGDKIIDEEYKRIERMRDSGTLSPAEHQRRSDELEGARETFNEARSELITKQAQLTGESILLGVTGLLATKSTVGGLVKGVESAPGQFILSSAAGDGLTFYSDQKPGVLTEQQVEQVFQNAENRMTKFDRNRYHTNHVKYEIRRQWNLWDNQVASRDMTASERTQKFYELVDQLQEDGWHVPEGIEQLGIKIVKTTSKPEEVPELREPEEVLGFVARGSLSLESKKQLEQLFLKLAKIQFRDAKPTDVVANSERVTLTVSPDRKASISSTAISVAVFQAGGAVSSRSFFSLGFNNASGEALTLNEDPIPGERLSVKSIVGTGRNKLGKRSHNLTWKAEHIGTWRWELTVVLKFGPDDVANKLVLKYDLIEGE